MPRFRDGFPRPKKESHHGAWRIVWRWDGKKYSIATNISDQGNAGDIEILIRNLASQLASVTRPKIPAPWGQTSGMIRYLADRYGEDPSAINRGDVANWIPDYQHEIQGKNTKGWIRDSVAMLEKLKAKEKGLEKVTGKSAATYMASIAGARSRGTHNRTLTVFKKFYAWLVITTRHDNNPFAAIKRLNEGKETPIVYCTREDRDEITVLALATGWPEWTAILIAFLTGMRRGEIANLRWDDVNFRSGTIFIQKTKTTTSRTLPMSTVLEEFLLGEPHKTGYVVKVLEGEDRLGRLNSLINRLKKDKVAALTKEWGILKPPPSKAKEFRKKWNEYKSAMAERERETAEAIDRIGWNVCRHTFAS